MLYTTLTKHAMKIAYQVHKSERDAFGRPYIYYPGIIAEEVSGNIALHNCVEEAVCVALLFNGVKEKKITVDYLAEHGFSDHIIRSLQLIKDCNDKEQLKLVKENKVARFVVIEVLRYNIDISRQSIVCGDGLKIQAIDWENIEKCTKAINYLLNDYYTNDSASIVFKQNRDNLIFYRWNRDKNIWQRDNSLIRYFHNYEAVDISEEKAYEMIKEQSKRLL